ncbi:hypothetical protein [Paenibacillus sp. YYML68]|uniref:hypothetical protein n=1 Tax=Paenibacillus sp. YYML68 TaxID=2909250 RepID=UPI002492AE4F|nr:hypothetical protein [Paenibacillus sp. YYML68]
MRRRQKLLWTGLLSVVLFTACGPKALPVSDPNRAQHKEMEQQSPSKPFKVLTDMTISWSGASQAEAVKLSYSNVPPIELRAETAKDKLVVPFEEVGYPESVQVLNLDTKGQKALAVHIHYYASEETVSSPIDDRWQLLVLGKQGEKLNTLFSSAELPMEQAGSYEVEFDQVGHIHIKDRATGFTSDFQIDFYNEEYKTLYKQAVEAPNIAQQLQPAKWFTTINVEQASEHAAAVIKLVKLIPGVHRNYPIGYMQYEYEWNEGQFTLRKQSLFTAKGAAMLEPQVITEQLFEGFNGAST